MERGYRDPALLRCEKKKSCGEMVQHNYKGLRKKDGSFFEIYQCIKCGSMRVWGSIQECFLSANDKKYLI